MIRKILLFLTVMLTTLCARAENSSISVKDVELPLMDSGVIEIELLNPTQQFADFTIGGIVLPDGIECVLDDDGNPTFTTGSRIVGTVLSGWDRDTHLPSFMLLASGTPIKGTSGVIVAPIIKVTGNLTSGTELQGKITNIMLTDAETLESVHLDDVDFTIKVVTRSKILLDENSTVMPTDASGVDVRVKRTINAGNWSTIVLPFAMTGEQVKSVFGDDALLLDFNGYETTEDGGDIVGISVKFNSVDIDEGIEANHPYVIKVSSAITEWTLDGVDISVEEEPTVATVKRTKKQWSELIGTYVAQTEVPSTCLVLNSNLFWYSTGKTTMKGYRAYFDFYDVLTDIEDAYSTNIRFVIDGETTEIANVIDRDAIDDAIYDLSGRRVNPKYVRKGVYIVGGKKVLIK